MTTTTPTPASATAPLTDLDLAKQHCEGRSFLVTSSDVARELLPNYSAKYARDLLNDVAAPDPVQVANNGSFLYPRLEVALFLLGGG